MTWEGDTDTYLHGWENLQHCLQCYEFGRRFGHGYCLGYLSTRDWGGQINAIVAVADPKDAISREQYARIRNEVKRLGGRMQASQTESPSP